MALDNLGLCITALFVGESNLLISLDFLARCVIYAFIVESAYVIWCDLVLGKL